MDTVLLFALPLVGGLTLCSTWNFTRWRVAREEGHRLYFRAVFGGAVLFAIIALSRALLEHFLPALGEFARPVKDYIGKLAKDPLAARATAEIAINCFLSMLAGYPAAWFLNIFFRRAHWLRRAINSDSFEAFLLNASDREFPVAVTMSDGKVYVGFVVQGSDPARARKYIYLLPLMSGYRKSETHKVTFTTFYLELYGHLGEGALDKRKPLPAPLQDLRAEDFITVLPVESISSCRLFDAKAYQEFQKRWKPPSKPSEPTILSVIASALRAALGTR